jgi:hypothetical protein
MRLRRLFTAGIALLHLSACELPQQATTSRPAATVLEQRAIPVEPFNVTANDALGIRLGSNRASIAKGATCNEKDKDDVSCIITPAAVTKLANADIGTVIVFYYKDKAVNITFHIDSTKTYDDILLRQAFIEKFGPGSREDGDQYRWNNAVSTMWLHVGRANTGGSLSMQLDRETSEWLAAAQKREAEKARKNL